MIDNIIVSITPYDLQELKEEDIEDLKNFVVQVSQLGFECSIVNKDTFRKGLA